MKIVFLCAAPRIVRLAGDETISLPGFVPSDEDIEETKKAVEDLELYFIEPKIPLMAVNREEMRERGLVVFEKIDNIETSILPQRDNDVIFVDCAGSRSIPEFLQHTGLGFYESAMYVFLNPCPFGPSTELANLRASEPKAYSLVEIATMKSSLFAGCFAPFQDFAMFPKDWSEIEKKHNIEFLSQLCTIAKTYLSMGFMDGNIYPLPDHEFEMWTCNMAITPLRTLQQYFGIYSPLEYMKDLPMDEFCNRAPFRKLLTEYVCKVLANVAMSSKLFLNTRNWYNPSTYVELQKRLSTWR
jgi:hypothetical protein